MEKEQGFVTRRIDELGRIVLPKRMRNALNLRENEEVNVVLEGNRILLTKKNDSCIFCGNPSGLISFAGKSICPQCIAILKNT